MSTLDDKDVLIITQDDLVVSDEILSYLKENHEMVELDTLKALMGATLKMSTNLEIAPSVLAEFFDAIQDAMPTQGDEELEAKARQNLQDKLEEDSKRLYELNKHWRKDCN